MLLCLGSPSMLRGVGSSHHEASLQMRSWKPMREFLQDWNRVRTNWISLRWSSNRCQIKSCSKNLCWCCRSHWWRKPGTSWPMSTLHLRSILGWVLKDRKNCGLWRMKSKKIILIFIVPVPTTDHCWSLATSKDTQTSNFYKTFPGVGRDGVSSTWGTGCQDRSHMCYRWCFTATGDMAEPKGGQRGRGCNKKRKKAGWKTLEDLNQLEVGC